MRSKRVPKLYVGGPYRYNDGTEGVAVRRIETPNQRDRAYDSLPPVMLKVREVVAHCASHARILLGGEL